MGWGMARPNAPEAVPTRTTGPIRTTSIILALGVAVSIRQRVTLYRIETAESHSLPHSLRAG